MRMVDLILKKRNGGELNEEEIRFIIEGFTNETIPDYQMSALSMAIYFNGMTEKETAALTMEMVKSGDVIDLSNIQGKKVDKHSTGGVGDKISLIVAPLVASIGIPVAKMSGRGLGHTGGTIDKLESFPGFNVELTEEQFTKQVNDIKMSIIGQTGNLTPADKRLYALRDVTATVDSIPLIASSIMSKKIAAGADSIVLDVKTGSGAFMKSFDDAKALAEEMVAIGKNVGRKTVAVITDMDQPLGFEIGNANEVKEAIEVLSGKDVTDLKTIALTIAGHMAVLGEFYQTFEEAYADLEKRMADGHALEVFRQFVAAQGGDASLVDDLSKLPQAKYETTFVAKQAGYVESIIADEVGVAAMLLGAGRATKDDQLDFAAGITLEKKVGDKVEAGDVIAVLRSNKEDMTSALERMDHAYTIGATEPTARPLVHAVIQ
ncbi:MULTISPECIES: pyrimidine-nucleoside phosphorylase [Exiguobacterium]|jgi:pyrimidine-nucleoside phosphorylase|uniref:pyrimidine-nucleoside phosphorylase n=1 Tax=Exiguobacterium TaxID=33986 RepID=UPI00103DB219|nr:MULTISPECIES: pyrimidine-nucleoside phosphorylase [Exiguobacterium]TCI72513.1 pyrimidine-nucleoside phosphorylase [Exiguobacterium sp. IPCI3]TCI81912.1 pyrimidine-nucleoside phosphorylase [Exiguobacterium sp. IPCH1]TCI83417.1 pyrimidine-nucleoside phosphorylase [Exiguobacterium sp. IPBC4]